MRTLLISLLLFTGAAQAQEYVPERVISRGSELAAWCKDEAEAHFIGQGLTPYQWTASHHDRSGVLHARGSLRVDGRTVEVRCQVAQGARERYATLDIVGA